MNNKVKNQTKAVKAKTKVAKAKARTYNNASIAESTLNDVIKVMRKHSSRKDGMVTVSREVIASKCDYCTRTVDRAIAVMKKSNLLVKTGGNYYLIK